MADHGKELSSIDFKSLIGGPLVAVVEAQAQAAMSTVNFIKAVGFKPPTKDDAGNEQASGEPIYVSFKYPKEVSPYEPAVPAMIQLEITDPGAGYTTPTVKISGTGSGATAEVTLGEGGQIVGITLTNAGSGYKNPPTVTVTDGASPAPAGFKAAAVKATLSEVIPAKAAVFQEMKMEVPMLSIVPIPYLRVEEVTIDFNAKINSMTTYEIGRESSVDTQSSMSASGGLFFGKASASFKCSTSNKSSSKDTGKTERTYSLAVHVKAVQDEMPGGMEKILGILEDAIKAQPVSAPPAQIT